MVKNLPEIQEMQVTWIWTLSWEDPLEEEMTTHSSNFHGQRSLEGYNPWGCRELETMSTHTHTNTAAAAKSVQSCPTLCDPIDGSPPGSLVPEILQARTLEWVAISFSNAWKWKVKGKSLSRAWFLVTPWTAAYQAPPFMGFSRKEYWSGMPLLSAY